MAVKYAAGLPTVGQFGNVRTLIDLAVTAERQGWDGVHLWDHVLYHQPDWPAASPLVAASVIATATTRIRIILTVALSRRQVQDVAQDTAAIAALSGGRLTIVATIGSMDREYTEFGLDPDLQARGRALDERLARLTDLWRQWSALPIPIWCGGRWPNKPGLRRAGRFDGAMPTFDGQRAANVPIEPFADATAYLRQWATGDLDIALEGATDGPSASMSAYAEAGMTWWIEALGWWRGDLAAASRRINAGPPTVT